MPAELRAPWGIGLGLGAALALTASAVAQVSPAGCGGLSNGGNGPFDYRKTSREQIALVEAYHFTPEVEMLLRGKSAQIGADIDYVLRAFPNHPRALAAMMRLAEKQKTPMPTGAGYWAECYFERALRFVPEDLVARMLYAMFLSRSARAPEALQQLDIVTSRAADNASAHYNAGLIYLEMKQYDKALAQAHAALALGLPRTELREQLRALGKWAEPVEAVSTAASAAAPAAAASAP